MAATVAELEAWDIATIVIYFAIVMAVGIVVSNFKMIMKL